MKKQDFVLSVWVMIRMEDASRKKLTLTKGQTTEVVDAVFATMAEVLERGEAIAMPCFGKFSVKQFPKGSMVYVPLTRKKIPRRPDRMRNVRFKPSKVLVNRVNRRAPVPA